MELCNHSLICVMQDMSSRSQHTFYETATICQGDREEGMIC